VAEFSDDKLQLSSYSAIPIWNLTYAHEASGVYFIRNVNLSGLSESQGQPGASLIQFFDIDKFGSSYIFIVFVPLHVTSYG
jgi:hypothetical protein